MSKQAAYKLAHGALNVVWEKLKTLNFLGMRHARFPKSVGVSSGQGADDVAGKA